MRRCFGLSRNLRRCSRSGDWRLFCHDHRRQPIVWAAFLVFTVIAGIASMQSAWFPGFPDANSASDLSESFRSLDPDIRTSLVRELRAFRDRHRDRELQVPIVFQSGSGSRQRLSADLEAILRDSGFRTRASSAMIVPGNPPPAFHNISITPNPGDIEVADQLASLLHAFIQTDFFVREEPGRTVGALTITIYGEPLFAENGAVSFR